MSASRKGTGTLRILMTMPDTAALADDLGRGQRVLVVLIGLVLVVHSVLLVLWLAPSSPVRDVVGNARLSTYVDPYFQQGVQTVGIGSNRVDESLSLRAYVRPEGGGEPTFSKWIDISGDEVRATRGSVESGRSHQIARRLATNLNFSLFSLTPAQREIVADTAADVPVARLQRDLQSSPTGSARDVRNFMAQDQMATQFASLWLGAVLPDVELLQVQYRVGRRVVPSYADRDDTKLNEVDFDWFSIGWRPAFRAEPAARASFATYVDGVGRG